MSLCPDFIGDKMRFRNGTKGLHFLLPWLYKTLKRQHDDSLKGFFHKVGRFITVEGEEEK